MSVLHYTNGFGRTMAAEKSSMPLSTLNSRLYQNRIPSHHYNKAMTPEQIEIVKLNRQLGKTYQQLATKYGMSVSSMRRYCQL